MIVHNFTTTFGAFPFYYFSIRGIFKEYLLIDKIFPIILKFLKMFLSETFFFFFFDIYSIFTLFRIGNNRFDNDNIEEVVSSKSFSFLLMECIKKIIRRIFVIFFLFFFLQGVKI